MPAWEGDEVFEDPEDVEAAEKLLAHLMDCSHYQRESAALKEMFGPQAELKFIGEDNAAK